MITVSGLVSGRVQGVGFRYFVRECARRCDVTGYANNLRDGRVEVLLSGAEAAVMQVKAQVEQGPRLASVTAVDWETRTYQPLQGFSIG